MIFRLACFTKETTMPPSQSALPLMWAVHATVWRLDCRTARFWTSSILDLMDRPRKTSGTDQVFPQALPIAAWITKGIVNASSNSFPPHQESGRLASAAFNIMLQFFAAAMQKIPCFESLHTLNKIRVRLAIISRLSFSHARQAVQIIILQFYVMLCGIPQVSDFFRG